MTPWKTISRKPLIHRPPFLTVEEHEVQITGGRIVPDWTWIITPDYVNVIAETTDGRLICFRQTKYAVEGTSLAIVGGFIEPGEAPAAAARRELIEETGYTSDHWASLGSYAVDANRGVGKAHFFLARQASPAAAKTADDLEQQEMLLLTRAEVEQALQDNEFKALAWVAAMSLGLQRLDEQPAK